MATIEDDILEVGEITLVVVVTTDECVIVEASLVLAATAAGATAFAFRQGGFVAGVVSGRGVTLGG